MVFGGNGLNRVILSPLLWQPCSFLVRAVRRPIGAAAVCQAMYGVNVFSNV